MSHTQNINIQEENDFRKIANLISKNYLLLISGTIMALGAAFFVNRYSIPRYKSSSSILIKASSSQSSAAANKNDFLYGNLFGVNQNFQNELWIMKSYPVIEKTVSNLDLSVTYYVKGKFNFYEGYKSVPFKVSYLADHPQPLDAIFTISFLNNSYFNLTAESKNVSFYNFSQNNYTHYKEKWTFVQHGKLGELIQTPDLAFIIESRDSTQKFNNNLPYGFKFSTISSLSSGIKSRMEFLVVDKQSTVINLSLISESRDKGVDILNELMDVYSEQNLERKNHLATITIDYIEKQLNEISDSLSMTEDNLQKFRSSNQLLNITDQAEGISNQYMFLQNQLGELVSRKHYFDYVSDLLKKDNFSNLVLPASIGISDQLLNKLMADLIAAESQRSNLIENNQARNPLVQKLGITIDNLKKTITENVTALRNSTSISIDEMNKRITKTEGDINRLPSTQRKLGTIERKYRLNDAIYNYLMEKHAEAKITKASNLPDDIIIEPAMGIGAISPNRKMNYMIGLFLGLAIPFGLVWLKSALNIKIESQEDIEHLTDRPVLGKILHSKYKTNNVIFEFPNSTVAESFRALRTNLDFYMRGGQKKIILVTSSLENEGKSFLSLNLAMSYAQLGRKTILVDFDLRKPKTYFNNGHEPHEGLSSYMIDKAALEDIIMKSPHEKLDYIPSGIIPPNPVELLALDKTEKLLATLRHHYDIIVLDTTPLAQVTDAYLLFDHSEVKIILARYSQTIKKVFSLVMKDINQKNVRNTCIVLTDNKVYNDQYGYGYGYYNKKSFFKRRSKRQKSRNGEYYSKISKQPQPDSN